MDAEQFIDAIRQVVYQSAIDGTLQTLTNPSGRDYRQKVADRTAWARSLDEESQRHLRSAITIAAHSAVFGFLCVLDGVRQIENEPGRGTLELTHKSSRGEVLLNDPTGDFLHDILNGMIEIV
jgi:hypothetical protein